MIKLSNEYIILKENEIVLVAGKPGVGKTRFIVNEVKNASYENKVLYVSVENSKAKLYEKYNLSTSENLIITNRFEINEIIELIDEIKPDYIYVDYLELIKGESVINQLSELNCAMMIVSMVDSKSDYSEYNEDKYNCINSKMIITDEGLSSL